MCRSHMSVQPASAIRVRVSEGIETTSRSVEQPFLYCRWGKERTQVSLLSQSAELWTGGSHTRLQSSQARIPRMPRITSTVLNRSARFDTMMAINAYPTAGLFFARAIASLSSHHAHHLWQTKR